MTWEVIAVPLFLTLLGVSFYMGWVSGAFQFAFGCSHDQLSRVFTIKKRTYKVCYECGHEIDYSWSLMCNLRPVSVGVSQLQPTIARRSEILFI